MNVLGLRIRVNLNNKHNDADEEVLVTRGHRAFADAADRADDARHAKNGEQHACTQKVTRSNLTHSDDATNGHHVRNMCTVFVG